VGQPQIATFIYITLADGEGCLKYWNKML